MPEPGCGFVWGIKDGDLGIGVSRYSGCKDGVGLDDAIAPQNLFNDVLAVSLEAILTELLQELHSVLVANICLLPDIDIGHSNVPLTVRELKPVISQIRCACEDGTLVITDTSHNEMSRGSHRHCTEVFDGFLIVLAGQECL